MALKKGRFSEEEKNYIKDNCKKMNLATLAINLNRSEKAVENTAYALGITIRQ